MAKKTWDEVIKKALNDYVHNDKIAYLYGTDGETGSDSLVDKMVAAYPSHFSGMNITSLKNDVRGKTCYDCSGWIHSIFGAPDMNSTSLINSCTNVSTDLVAGLAGSVCWKEGHVGIDIGYGFCLDIPSEFNTIRMQKISEYNWTKSGQLSSYCDYSGATNR